MDSISNKVTFSIGALRSRVDDPSLDWQLLLRIEAEFSLRVGDRDFYTDEYFNIVEFLVQSVRWSSNPKGDFWFESMDSDSPMFGFVEHAGGQFSLASEHQLFDCHLIFGRQQLVDEINRFSNATFLEIKNHLDIDVRRVVWPENPVLLG